MEFSLPWSQKRDPGLPVCKIIPIRPDRQEALQHILDDNAVCAEFSPGRDKNSIAMLPSILPCYFLLDLSLLIPRTECRIAIPGASLFLWQGWDSM